MTNQKSIWGFGSLRLIRGETTIEFPYAIHQLSFQIISKRSQSISGRIFTTQMKFRPKIKATIHICSSTDLESIIRFIQILNVPFSTITVSPQYNAQNTQNVQYVCILDNKQLKFSQLANAQVGQSIELSFIAKELITSLPIHTSNYQIFNIVDHQGAYIVDASSNQLIIKTY